jgi:hypothetical protein
MLLTDWLSSFTGLIGCKNGVMSRLSNFRGGRARHRRRPGLLRQQFLASPLLESLEDRLLLAATNPLELSSLDGTNGFRLDGVAANDRAGSSVSNAGDVNGDGYDDLIIGAPFADPGSVQRAGEAYLVFGQRDGFPSSFELSSLDGTNGFTFTGFAALDDIGISVSGAGDVNGDGFDDIIIGSEIGTSRTTPINGELFVVFGHAGDFDEELSPSDLDGNNGFIIQSIERIGEVVSNAGDINGDGFDDVAFQSIDKGFVVFGMEDDFPVTINTSALDGTNGFRLVGDVVQTIAGGGDINGDGFDDLLIESSTFLSYSSTTGARYRSEAVVVFGQPAVSNSSVDLTSLSASDGFRLEGIHADRGIPLSLSTDGDVNGDGFDGLIVGSQYIDEQVGPDGMVFRYRGPAYVVFGKSDSFGTAFNVTTLDGTNGFVFTSVDNGEFATSVSGGGDVNGDGFDDLLVGAPRENGIRDGFGYLVQDTGRAYVIFGQASGFAASTSAYSVDGVTGFAINGIDVGDRTGSSVSDAGDVNGDGFDDLIIGSPFSNADGAAFVVFGGNFTGGVETWIGSTFLFANQGADAVDILVGDQMFNRLTSDGGPDVLRGGEGDDLLKIPDADFSSTRRLQGGNGTDTLQLVGNSLTLDLTTIHDNRIVDIEQINIRNSSGIGDNTLTLDFQEVVNISSHSNILTVLHSHGDTVNIGSGWTASPDESTAFTNAFTQGAATLRIRENVPTVRLSVATAKGAEFPSTVITATATANFAVRGEQTVEVLLTDLATETRLGAGVLELASQTIVIEDGATSGSTTFTFIDDGPF